MDPASSTSGGSCSDVGEEKAVSILPEQDQMKTSQASPADDVSKSQPPLPNVSSALSVDAPPFESVWSNSSSSTKLSVFAPEFVPKSVTTPSDYGQQFYQDGNFTEQYEEGERSDPLTEYAFQVLYEITCNPGHFNRLCDQLISTLNSWPSLDEGFLLILIDEVVAQAIREPNFRYNGARLCNAIAKKLNAGSMTGNNFRTLLFNHCAAIHNGRKDMTLSDADYLRGFALFMSELFVHVSPKGSGPTRFALLGRAVRELLQTLLEHPTPGNIKCLCQILKLSGSYIEDDDRHHHAGKPVDMDALMANIDTVARTVDMQMHIKDLLRNMIELRATDWGRARTSPVGQESHLPLHPSGSQMGVYYGPDGQALTAEETEFLDQSLKRQGDEEEYDYAEDEETGMDDEMAEAFEKFLMMQDALK